MKFEQTSGGVSAPQGFASAGIHAGIRKNKNCKDLALMKSDVPCTAASMYTQNKVAGAPIVVTKENLADGKAQAIICNSGNANTCNADGIEVAKQMCELTAKALGLAKEDIIVASTGVIGIPLNIAPIANGMQELVAALNDTDGSAAAKAIMTTDTVAKELAVKFDLNGKTCHIGAIAKGSGMIHPNMATMLSFITTDVAISKEMLEIALKDAVVDSFNMVSVDGDTSTNDMVSIIANGLAGNETIAAENADYQAFSAALKYICIEMAKKIAGDGEGASKLLECVVNNGPDQQLVKDIAKSVITSSLTKAAMFGADANWGRVLCAIGYTEGEFDINTIDVSFGSAKGAIDVCKDGEGIEFSEELAKEILLEDEIKISIDMGQGKETATAWGCDLTYEYVKINGDYRT